MIYQDKHNIHMIKSFDEYVNWGFDMYKKNCSNKCTFKCAYVQRSLDEF